MPDTPKIAMHSLSEVERAAWLSRAVGELMNTADGCGISRESEWYQRNLKLLGELARGEHDA